MWQQVLQQYKRTFRGMQIAIAVVTIGSLVLTHRVFVAAAFLVTMQVGAIFGAAWGVRLKTLFEGSRDRRLPARRV
jgi:hypothetical protein